MPVLNRRTVPICRSAMASISYFSGQLRIGQPASNDMAHSKYKALYVGHVAVIVAPRLLVNVGVRAGQPHVSPWRFATR
jgi:hypothetical protein